MDVLGDEGEFRVDQDCRWVLCKMKARLGCCRVKDEVGFWSGFGSS